MTPIQVLLLSTVAVLAVALFGVWQLVQAHLDRRDLARRSELARVEYEASLPRTRLDARIRRTRLGVWLANDVSRAGVSMTALDLLSLYAGAALGGFVLVSWLTTTLLGPVGLAIGIWGVRQWLEVKRKARLEEFVAQLPELARILSNATSAGRSLLSALQLAADDIDDPARSELRVLSEQLRIGQPIDEALATLQDRLPSRELTVLVSTLVIQQRTGGDVVTALRDMAQTLDDRQELRREVSTIVAGAVQTGYVTGGMGLVLILGANAMRPGMIEEMVRSPIGVAALAIAGALYVFAFGAIRRMTDIDI